MKKLMLLALFFPLFASAQTWTFPNGKTFAEYTTPNGYTIFQEIVGVFVTPAHADELSWRDILEQYMRSMATLYGNDPKLTLETNNGESQWNHVPTPDVPDYAYRSLNILGDNGDSCGVTQLQYPTYLKWKKESGLTDLKYCYWADDLKLQAWAFSKGEKYRRAWTIYRDTFVNHTRPISTNW